MHAWRVTHPAPITQNPLEWVEIPEPEAGPGELQLRVLACGVCRTDLHVSEGDLPVHREHVIPGHEVVGEVTALGEGVTGFAVGDRVGVAWLRHTCGTCKYCRAGAENLCPNSRYTGWDANGGYAEVTTVPADFAYRLPDGYSDTELAPLLCAGIIGYRALERAELPEGGVLGLYGYDMPPEPLDAAILFAPVGDIVIPAMRALDRGGTLACAGIYLSDIPPLHYEADLFYEKQLRSVTSNTRGDGEAFLAFAGEHHLDVTTHEYALADGQRALQDLKAGAFAGAAVLVP